MVPWRNWVRWESAGAMHCPLWLGMGRGCCVQCSSIGFCPGLLSAVVGGGLWCSFVLVCSSRVQVGAVWVRDRPVCGATAESPRRYGQTRMYLLISLSMLVVTDMYAGSEPVCIACMLCFRWWLQGVRTGVGAYSLVFMRLDWWSAGQQCPSLLEYVVGPAVLEAG